MIEESSSVAEDSGQRASRSPPQVHLQLVDFISAASFWIPDYRRYSPEIEHAPFFFWLAETHRPSSFVELGIGSGVSFFALCQAVQRVGLNCKCCGTGLPNGGGDRGDVEDDVDPTSRHNACYSPFSTLSQVADEDAAALFPDRSIDLLLISGRSFGADAQRQFDPWLAKLSDRAVVICGDTGAHKAEISRLWSYLQEKYPHFEFPHSSGLGLVLIGAQTDDRLRMLCDHGRGQLGLEIRQAYARLGQGLGDRFGRLSLRETVALKDAALGAREVGLTRLKNEWRAALALKDAALGAREAELTHLKNEWRAARRRVTELDEELAERIGEVERLNSDVAHFADSEDALHARLRESAAALDATHRSASWRVTAPLRRFGSRHPRAARGLRRVAGGFWGALRPGPE
jgi:methyltransferase family protein